MKCICLCTHMYIYIGFTKFKFTYTSTHVYMYTYTVTVYNTKGTRAHTHRELIRKWLWEPKGSSLEYTQYIPVDARELCGSFSDSSLCESLYIYTLYIYKYIHIFKYIHTYIHTYTHTYTYKINTCRRSRIYGLVE